MTTATLDTAPAAIPAALARGYGGGGPSPTRIVVAYGFWIFILSDIVMFSALFAAYAVLSGNTAGGPTGRELFNLRNVFIETMYLLLTVFFYVVVYTMWLKRRTPQNIVIGGAAGALPPVIGWVAATGQVAVEPLLLFLIILLWTPPHFWMSLNRAGEYAHAGIPMLPVVAGRSATKRQVLVYSALLAAASLSPCAFGFTGALYGAVASIVGAVLLLLAMQLYASKNGRDAAPAHRLFAFSILDLFLLFAGLLADTALLR
jgi:protoheme IX farnesyltransferase